MDHNIKKSVTKPPSWVNHVIFVTVILVKTHSSHEKFNTLHHSKREEFLLRGSPLIFLLLKSFER